MWRIGGLYRSNSNKDFIVRIVGKGYIVIANRKEPVYTRPSNIVWDNILTYKNFTRIGIKMYKSLCV